MATRIERIEGGLLGLLIGDALGVPYEFKPPEQVPAQSEIEFQPPPAYLRSHTSVEPGTWSDDGAQALCLLESLLHCGQLDAEDFAQRMLRWLDFGHLAVDGHVFDVGRQTCTALSAIRAGQSALNAASRAESANGNGALMRVLPLALWHRGSDAELVRDARASSLPTHAHLRSQLCCALYCLWARRTLEGATDPWTRAVTALREITAHDRGATREIDEAIQPDAPPEHPGSGYVVDTLRSARALIQRHGSYEQVVRAAITLGHDTDTTAAVVGGIAGVREGSSAIPQRWRQGLRGQELLGPLLEGLLRSAHPRAD